MSDKPVRGLEALPPEQELAVRDPALQGLGILLDPDLFAGLAQLRTGPAGAPAAVRSARLVDVRYVPGSECVATYVLGDGAAETWVHARALPRGARVRTPAPDPAEPERSDDWLRTGYGVLVQGFPHDEGLPGLAAFASDATRSELLATLVPDEPGLTVRTLSYDPGVRWVGCAEGARGPVASIRIHSAERFDAARWNAQSLTDASRPPGDGGPVLPRLLGHSRYHGALAHAWTAGRPLERALLDGGLPAIELEAVGAAISALHERESERLPHGPPAVGAAALRRLAGTLAFLLPRSAARVRRLAERLVRRLVELPAETRSIHGNLKPGKLLLQGGGRVVLLDLDRACLGPPARDLGTLLAHVEDAAIAGRLGAAQAAAAQGAIRRGYERTTRWPLREHDVALHTTAALFELALRPFRCLAPEWPDRTAAILARAEQLLPL